MTDVTCGHCNLEFTADRDLRGRNAMCPQCGTPVAVPASPPSGISFPKYHDDHDTPGRTMRAFRIAVAVIALVAAAALAVFLVPVFFVMTEGFVEWRHGPPKQLPPDDRVPTLAADGKAEEKERASEREPTADERTANPMPEARG